MCKTKNVFTISLVYFWKFHSCDCHQLWLLHKASTFISRRNNCLIFFHIVTKCFIYDISDATVSQVTNSVERHRKGLNSQNLFQVCSRHPNKHTVVVKVSNTSLDDLSVSKGVPVMHPKWRSYSPLSSLCVGKNNLSDWFSFYRIY